MSNHSLLPIFKLLPSRGLRYIPIRPIGSAVVVPPARSAARAVQRVTASLTQRNTNQIPS